MMFPHRSSGIVSIVIVCLGLGAAAGPASVPETDVGTVSTPDEVELAFRKIGDGPDTIILPAGLFLRPEFDLLAEPGRTLIYYDMRNRGASGSVDDPARLTIQGDVRDLETIRKGTGKVPGTHFGTHFGSPYGCSQLK